MFWTLNWRVAQQGWGQRHVHKKEGPNYLILEFGCVLDFPFYSRTLYSYTSSIMDNINKNWLIYVVTSLAFFSLSIILNHTLKMTFASFFENYVHYPIFTCQYFNSTSTISAWLIGIPYLPILGHKRSNPSWDNLFDRKDWWIYLFLDVNEPKTYLNRPPHH